MKRKLNRQIFSPIFIVLALIVTACGQNQPEIKTSIQFSWLHSIEFVGFYVAAEKGYYAEQKLTVDMRSGGFKDNAPVDPLKEVLEGRADFGITDATLILTARSEDKPLVAIGTIYQRHPLALVSLAEKKIVAPKDLIGKTVQVSLQSSVPFRALLQSQKIDPKQLTIVERSDFSIAPLTSQKADVIDGWAISEVVTLKEQGIAYNAIFPSDYGIDFYPDVIFTTEDTITKKPDLVKRFLAATVKGMQTAVDNPNAAAVISAKYDTIEPLARQESGMNQSLALIAPAKGKPATMQSNVWTATYQMLQNQSLLKKEVDVQKAYTLTFLDQVYAK